LTDDARLATVDTLLGLLRDARMPATWASHRPSASEAVVNILAEAVGHEIALASEGQPGGIRWTREISRQLEQAERAGYGVSTLATRMSPQADELQSLCKMGIAAIAGTSAAGAATSVLHWLGRVLWDLQNEPPQPYAMRYGVWSVPAALELPAARGFGTRRALANSVQDAAACGDVLHAVIPLQKLQQGRAGGVRQIERLLQAAFELRSERRLTIQTVANVAARLRPQRRGVPAESILRRAA
jgi:hypothetical protein